jgi:hypothetical protein
VLHDEIDECETALIWNPTLGFRLTSPEREANHALSLPETFLTILAMNLSEDLMRRMTGEYLAHFKKH